jgi:hypothetical protein
LPPKIISFIFYEDHNFINFFLIWNYFTFIFF